MALETEEKHDNSWMQRSLWIRFATFLVWLLAAASTVYWALQFVQGPASPLSAAVAAPAPGGGAVDALALAKGLGGGNVTPRDASPEATPAAPAAPSIFQAARFVLTGVVVNRPTSGQGVALIAVDGKPPRPYRVGTPLADGIVLHSVSAGKAMLAASADAAPGLTLELPQLTSAVAGTAVAARPPMPAAIPATAATPVANPMAVPGTRPPRPLANRQREAEREARKEAQDAAPAQ
jgi:general secretion pathway protein C